MLLCLAPLSVGAAPAAAPPRVIYSLANSKDDREIIALIDAARTRIYFAIYLFTLRDIANALLAAKARGVAVRGLVDAGESRSPYEAPIISDLRCAGIPVESERHADGNGIMHIKAIVTEEAYAVGSYNWTRSATTENDELLEIGTDPAAVAAYERILEGLFDRYANSRVAASNAATSARAKPVAVYDYTEAPAHIGERASVRGRLHDAYTLSGGTVFLDFCADYKRCPFSGVIFAESVGKFGDLSQYAGKAVTFTGTISSYRGRAEIKLSDPSQLASGD